MGGAVMFFDSPDVLAIMSIVIVVVVFCLYWITHTDQF